MLNVQGRRRLAQQVLQQTLPTWTSAGAQLGVGMGRYLSSDPGWDNSVSASMQYNFVPSISLLHFAPRDTGIVPVIQTVDVCNNYCPCLCRARGPPETLAPPKSRGRGRGLGLPAQPQQPGGGIYAPFHGPSSIMVRAPASYLQSKYNYAQPRCSEQSLGLIKICICRST